MPVLALVVALVLGAVPAVAAAHVELESSSPAAGANLDAAPTEVTLTFDGELDPDGSSFTVVDHHGEEVGGGGVDLDVADRNVLTGPVTIGEPGVYTVEWTVLGVDGHEISGEFSFGYATDEEIPEGESDGHGHESPDTAMGPSRTGSPLSGVGLALLGLAAVLGLRRTVPAVRRTTVR